MNHVRTMKHLQMEQIHQLQKRSEGGPEQTEIGEIFQVLEEGQQPGSNAEGPKEREEDQEMASSEPSASTSAETCQGKQRIFR